MVAEVARVLGRPRGIRIGEAPDRDGQYFHYLAMWLFALARTRRSGGLRIASRPSGSSARSIPASSGPASA